MRATLDINGVLIEACSSRGDGALIESATELGFSDVTVVEVDDITLKNLLADKNAEAWI